MPVHRRSADYGSRDIAQIHQDWADLVGYDRSSTNAAERNEALAFARAMMQRAQGYVLEVIDELQQAGYRFVEPERIYIPPDSETRNWLERLPERSIHLPIALQAWLLEVGHVNLMGTHPSWPTPAYAFEDRRGDGYPIYTDPLVVELMPDFLDYLHDEWLEEQSGEAFIVDLAPDHLHKAGISGGMPYGLPTDRPRVDSILLYERHCTSFTGYLRRALYWRGFPGFDYMSQEDIAATGWRSDPAAVI